MTTVEPEIAHIIIGAIDDWEVIEASTRSDILRIVEDRHLQTRCVSNIETCLIGVSDLLSIKLLGEVEDVLKISDAHGKLKAMLLQAPLFDIDKLNHLCKLSLSEGFASIASIFDYVREYQPHLRRITDIWLATPLEYFALFPGGRQQIWRMAVDNEVIIETLEASSYYEG